MRRSNKFIVVAVLATVVVVGTVTGVVLAQNGGNSQPESKYGALLNRICEIYQENTGVAVNSEALKEAFAQAQSEMRTEALENRLQKLVDEGKITQDEATAYKEWLQARPDMEQFRQQFGEWWQARPGIPPELKEWQESRPDVPLGFGFGGHGGFRGPLGWGRLYAPTE